MELTHLRLNKTGQLKIGAISSALAADAAEKREQELLLPGMGAVGAVGGRLMSGAGAVMGGMAGGIGALAGGVAGGLTCGLAGGLAGGLGDMMGADSENVLVLVKLQIPGDEELISQPIRIAKGPVPKIARFDLGKRSYHGAQEGRARM